MHKIKVTFNTQELHPVFRAKLKRYGFIRIGIQTFISPFTVDDLAAVFFYKKNLESKHSPLKVTAA